MKDALCSPTAMRRFHGYAAVFWFLVAFPIMYFLSDSVRIVTFLSVYALVVSHWAAYQASRAEDAQTTPETPPEMPRCDADCDHIDWRPNTWS